MFLKQQHSPNCVGKQSHLQGKTFWFGKKRDAMKQRVILGNQHRGRSSQTLCYQQNDESLEFLRLFSFIVLANHLHEHSTKATTNFSFPNRYILTSELLLTAGRHFYWYTPCTRTQETGSIGGCGPTPPFHTQVLSISPLALGYLGMPMPYQRHASWQASCT